MKKYIISVSLILVTIFFVILLETNDKNNELYVNQNSVVDSYEENFIDDDLSNTENIEFSDDILLNTDEQSNISDLNIDKSAEENENTTESTNKIEDLVEKIEKITISISCKTILDNLQHFPENKHVLIPSDGIILPKSTVEIADGDSVFDVLLKVTKENKIHMEFVNTPIYGSAYIEGINNIYEFDCGDLSGWMYKVNGVFPSIGISNYILNDSDEIEILYSCDLGKNL